MNHRVFNEGVGLVLGDVVRDQDGFRARGIAMSLLTWTRKAAERWYLPPRRRRNSPMLEFFSCTKLLRARNGPALCTKRNLHEMGRLRACKIRGGTRIILKNEAVTKQKTSGEVRYRQCPGYLVFCLSHRAGVSHGRYSHRNSTIAQATCRMGVTVTETVRLPKRHVAWALQSQKQYDCPSDMSQGKTIYDLAGLLFLAFVFFASSLRLPQRNLPKKKESIVSLVVVLWSWRYPPPSFGFHSIRTLCPVYHVVVEDSQALARCSLGNSRGEKGHASRQCKAPLSRAALCCPIHCERVSQQNS